MKRFLAVVLLALLAFPAYGAKVKVTWTNPSTNTDGTALTNLASITVEWGVCSGASVMGALQAAEKVITTAAGATMSTFAYPVALSPVCIAAYATDSNGNNSALSNVVQWTPPATPGQPIAGVIRLTFKSKSS